MNNNSLKSLHYNADDISTELLRKQLQNFTFEEITNGYDWASILKELDFDKINESTALKGYHSLTMYLDMVITDFSALFCGIPDIKKKDLIDYIEQTNDKLTVADLFLIKLHEKEMTTGKTIKDSDIYKKACVNKDVYSRFINMRTLKTQPSKSTVICLGLALELPSDELQFFMNTAGYSFRKSDDVDILIMYFVKIRNCYDVLTINEWICKLYGERKAIVKPPRQEKVEKVEKVKTTPKTYEQQMVDFMKKYGIDVLHTEKGDLVEFMGKLIPEEEYHTALKAPSGMRITPVGQTVKKSIESNPKRNKNNRTTK